MPEQNLEQWEINKQKEPNKLKMIGLLILIVIGLGALFFMATVAKHYLDIKKDKEPGGQGLIKVSDTLDVAVFEKLVTTAGPSFGNKEAKVKIVEFADFACSSCKSFFPVMRKVMNEEKDRVFVVFKSYLLWESSLMSAEAGRCAHDQGKFWALHDLMFQNQQMLQDSGSIKALAIRTGLEMAKFNQCLDSAKYKTVVEADSMEGVNAGVDGTPTIFINGKKIVGVLSEERLKAEINSALNNK